MLLLQCLAASSSGSHWEPSVPAALNAAAAVVARLAMEPACKHILTSPVKNEQRGCISLAKTMNTDSCHLGVLGCSHVPQLHDYLVPFWEHVPLLERANGECVPLVPLRTPSQHYGCDSCQHQVKGRHQDSLQQQACSNLLHGVLSIEPTSLHHVSSLVLLHEMLPGMCHAALMDADEVNPVQVGCVGH